MKANRSVAYRAISIVCALSLALLVGCSRGPADREPAATDSRSTTGADSRPVQTEANLVAFSLPAGEAFDGPDDQESGVLRLVSLRQSMTLVTGGPVVHGDVTIIGTATGVVRGLLPDGTVLWNVDLDTRVLALALSRVRVYGTTGSSVFAIDPADGSPIWEHTTTATPATAPTSTGVTVITGLRSGEVVALDSATGAERWRTRLAASVVGPIVATDGRALVVTRDAVVQAISLADGTVEWSVSIDEPVRAAISVAGVTVRGGVAAAGTVDGAVALVALADGGVERLPSTDGEHLVPPIAIDRLVYTFASNGVVLARDRSTGDSVWTRSLPTDLFGTPLLRGEYLVLGQAEGLASISAADGRDRSVLALGAGAFGGAHVRGHELYQSLNDGALVAVDLDANASDPPLLTEGRSWSLPSDGAFRLRDASVSLLMRSASDARFVIDVASEPTEELILTIADEDGSVVATNMGHTSLDPSIRVELRAGRGYTLLVRRTSADSEVVLRVTPRRAE